MSIFRFASIRSLAIAITLVALFVTGCGQSSAVPTAAVSGRVTLGDQPVTEGIVSFVSKQGFGASAPLQPDGTYRLQSQHGAGIPLGAYKVIVQPPAVEINENDPNPQKPSESSLIPRKYRDLATSDLEFNIGEEGQVFDIQLAP